MAGVPILNKIPYISRLFKNTGVGRETESLMLMVTPRIIIQEDVDAQGDVIRLKDGLDSGTHIRPLGQDFRAGDKAHVALLVDGVRERVDEARVGRGAARGLVVPVLAVLSALVIGGFVIGVEGAVTIGKAGAAETFRGIGNQLPRRVLLRGGCGGVRHLKYK